MHAAIGGYTLCANTCSYWHTGWFYHMQKCVTVRACMCVCGSVAMARSSHPPRVVTHESDQLTLLTDLAFTTGSQATAWVLHYTLMRAR